MVYSAYLQKQIGQRKAQEQTFYFKWTPTKVEKDKATIEQEIIGVVMDIEIGGSKISYDSTKDNSANNPLGDFFNARCNCRPHTD